MVIGKRQILLGAVLVAAVVVALVVFHRGGEKPLGATGRTADITRGIRAELKGKTLCGFCMEPEAEKHAVGDIAVKELGGDVYQAEIACECRATPDGKPRVKVLRREYASVNGEVVCTMPNLGWLSPEEK